MAKIPSSQTKIFSIALLRWLNVWRLQHDAEGWSDTRVFQTLGLSPTLMFRYLNGECLPKVDTCSVLARTLGIPVREVLAAAGYAESDEKTIPSIERFVVAAGAIDPDTLQAFEGKLRDPAWRHQIFERSLSQHIRNPDLDIQTRIAVLKVLLDLPISQREKRKNPRENDR